MRPTIHCARCGSPMVEGVLATRPMARCPRCSGLLIPQRALIPTLEHVARGLADRIDLDQEIDPAADTPGDIACPRCDRAMSRFGYMGTRVVILDRCDRCNEIWMDPEELGVAAILWARTNLRTEARRARSQSAADDFAKRVDRILLARAAASRLVGGFTAI